MSERGFVAMSGGVDSSVAALLLREQGCSLSGVHLRLLHNEDLGQGCESACCSLSDAEDARSVARKLGFPFYVFDFADIFRSTVVQRFLDGYEAGETPNPCMDCNRFVKWGELLHRTEVLGRDFLATGHYARIQYDPASERWLLLRGKDTSKDQSYFLSHLTQHQLSRTRLPLGDLSKPEVRELAEQYGLINARKRDSQDLCFAPDGDYAAFWERMKGYSAQPGAITDLEGTPLGTHKGLIRYTLGQHKGLGISSETPLYVCKKDADHNTLVVGPSQQLFHTWLSAREVNWIALSGVSERMEVQVQTRYHQIPQKAWVCPTETGFRVDFAQPQRAMTPGQTVALYDGDVVLGAGVIDATGN